MKSDSLNFKNVLEIIFKTIKKNAYVFADSYLIKDASVISKWKSNKLIPSSDDMIKIVDFTMNESTGTQRKIIREKIEILLLNSLLKENIKGSLLKIEDFQDFLMETLNVSTCILDSGNTQLNICEKECSESKGNTRNNETIAAFSNDLEGKYSGIVEFNLTLSKDGWEKSGNKSAAPEMNLKNNISFNVKSQLDGFQRQLKGKGILGIVVIGVISGFFILQMINGSQAPGPQSGGQDLKVYSAMAGMKNTPIPTNSPMPTNTPANTPAPFNTPIPVNTPAPVKKLPAAVEDGRGGSGSSNRKAPVTKKNNIETGDEIIDSTIVNGDKNLVVHDNENVSINIEK